MVPSTTSNVSRKSTSPSSVNSGIWSFSPPALHTREVYSAANAGSKSSVKMDSGAAHMTDTPVMTTGASNAPKRKVKRKETLTKMKNVVLG